MIRKHVVCFETRFTFFVHYVDTFYRIDLWTTKLWSTKFNIYNELDNTRWPDISINMRIINNLLSWSNDKTL